jgi:uncharacterized protein (UPF0332 family)
MYDYIRDSPTVKEHDKERVAYLLFTRTRGGEEHATVVEFVEERLGTAYVAQVRLFDQMRRKRHRVIYEVAGLVSKEEAEQAIAFSREIVEKIIEIIIGQSRLGIQ